MAITLGTIAQFHGSSISTLGGSVSGGSSITAIAVFIYRDGATTNTITSITYGGQNMALINGSGTPGGFNGHLDTYVLINPSTGTQTVTANFSSSNNDFIILAVPLNGTYTGVGSNSIGNNFAQGFNNASGPQSTSLNTTRPNSIAMFCWFGWSNAGGFTTQTGGTTNQFSLEVGGGNGNIACKFDTVVKTVAGQVNDGWTTINSNIYGFSAIEIFAPSTSSSDTLFF